MVGLETVAADAAMSWEGAHLYQLDNKLKLQ